MMHSSVFIVLLWCIHFLLTVKVAFANEVAVVKKIFQGYDRTVRPLNTSSRPLVIDFTLQYLHILKLNGAEESITINTDYKMEWTDEYLQWSPSDFAQPVYSVHVHSNLIWQPDVTLEELLATTPLLSDGKLRARIEFNGRVTVYNPQVITFSCKMKIDRFPFDKQKCNLNFGPWTYDSTQVTFKRENASNSTDDLNRLEGDSEWEITSFSSRMENDVAYTISNYSVAHYIIEIRRNPLYYICVMLLPTFIITTLCLLGIFTPSRSTGEREEKVTLGLTTLLTVAVILSIAAGQLPKTTRLPLLGYFLVSELFICTLAVLASILIMFHHERAVSYRLRPPKWVRIWLSRKKNEMIRESFCVTLGAAPPVLIGGKAGGTTIFHNNYAEFEKVIALIRQRIEKEEHECHIIELWNKFYDYIDLICLVFFQIANILTSAYLLFWMENE